MLRCLLLATLALSLSAQAFDSEFLAKTDDLLVQAYTERDHMHAFHCTKALFAEQYNLTGMQSDEVALNYTQAAGIFTALPVDATAEDYEKLVLPHLVEAYQRLAVYTPIENPQTAAEANLQWWLVRKE
jgi:hypothetical protein